MGYGTFSADAYADTSRARMSAGRSAMGFTDDVLKGKPRDAWTVHEDMNPAKLAGPASPLAGQPVRESRDNADSTESLAISVMFDVTGSMGGVPRKMQKTLPELHNLLVRKGYVAYPQILFGGIGDKTAKDRVPLQIGQFESDNTIDTMIGNIALEGGGGGGMQESYELAMYYMARHTFIDCLEKRGKKGYLFLIGDEAPYPVVSKDQLNELVGTTLQEDVETRVIAEELKAKYEVFVLRPTEGGYAANSVIRKVWEDLFPGRVIELQDADTVAFTIASLIGMEEGYIDSIDSLKDYLKDAGIDATAVDKTATTLVPYAEATKDKIIPSPDLPVGGAPATRL